MAPNPESTRQQLIAAAQTLFAERTIDAVSLREINTAAGQRNSSALQYHFGDRAGLLRAVLSPHHRDVELRRHAMLDEYESNATDDLRALVAGLVRPAASKLSDPDGGRAYLRITAQLVNRPEFTTTGWGSPDVADAREARHDSVERWRQLIAPLLPAVARDRLHRRFTALRLTYIELARRAEFAPSSDDRLFTSHLIDLVTAVIDAPLSEETNRLLARRPTRSKAAR
jgi:AcrR family transcriptional regulator